MQHGGLSDSIAHGVVQMQIVQVVGGLLHIALEAFLRIFAETAHCVHDVEAGDGSARPGESLVQRVGKLGILHGAHGITRSMTGPGDCLGQITQMCVVDGATEVLRALLTALLHLADNFLDALLRGVLVSAAREKKHGACHGGYGGRNAE